MEKTHPWLAGKCWHMGMQDFWTGKIEISMTKLVISVPVLITGTSHSVLLLR
jgi:hypothetical protein